MTSVLLLCGVLTASTHAPRAEDAPAPAAERLEDGARLHAVPPILAGLKGGCLGGACGACLGFGVPGMCVGGLLGWYVDDLSSAADALEEQRAEEKEAADKARQAVCEEGRSKAPQGSEASRMDCSPPGSARPWGQVALGAGGTALAALVLGVAVVAAAAVTAGGTFFTVRSGLPTAALIGAAVGAGLLVGGLVVANLAAAVMWGPLGVWFVLDQLRG